MQTGEGLFFVIGRGRSGTTLLCRMLNMSPNIHVAPEGLFILDLHKKYGSLKPAQWSEKKLGQFVDDVKLFRRMETWEIDSNELLQQLIEIDQSDRIYARVCLQVYAYHASANSPSPTMVLGDKNPLYSRYLPLLQDLFPQARFIYLVRNIKDNILSYQQVYFDMRKTADLAWRWKKYNREIQESIERFPHKYLKLSYEDLARNGEHELTRVTEFLGIPYDPVMLSFSSKPADRTASLGWHQNLTRKLNTSSIDKWKTDMGDEEIRLVDFIEPPGGKRKDDATISIRLKALQSLLKTQVYSFAEKTFYELPLPIRARLSNQLRNPDKR
jgi:uncharacterized protein (DUF924 family)